MIFELFIQFSNNVFFTFIEENLYGSNPTTITTTTAESVSTSSTDNVFEVMKTDNYSGILFF